MVCFATGGGMDGFVYIFLTLSVFLKDKNAKLTSPRLNNHEQG